MSESMTPEIVEEGGYYPPGRHPNSLAALRPPKKGEVRNPTGTNRYVRLREKALREVHEELTEKAQELARALIVVATDPTHPKQLEALDRAFRYLGLEMSTPSSDESGRMSFTVSWAAPPPEREVG